MHEVREIGPHYARTLRQWRERFLVRRAEVDALGLDVRFQRTWEFYLAFCEAAFATHALRDVQLVLTRPLKRTLAALASASQPGCSASSRALSRSADGRERLGALSARAAPPGPRARVVAW